MELTRVCELGSRDPIGVEAIRLVLTVIRFRVWFPIFITELARNCIGARVSPLREVTTKSRVTSEGWPWSRNAEKAVQIGIASFF